MGKPREDAARSAWAEAYIRDFSMALIEIPPGRKGPNHKDWNKSPVREAEIAKGIWDHRPDANMGALLGTSKIVSFDVDYPDGAKVALAAVGVDIQKILDQGVALHGNPMKGKRLFRAPANTELALKKLLWPPATPGTRITTVLELRAGDGAQDVLPPSIHPETGKAYEFLQGRDPWALGGFSEMPEDLLGLWRLWADLLPKMRAACPWAPFADSGAKPVGVVNGVNPEGRDWEQIRKEIVVRLPLRALLAKMGMPFGEKKFPCPLHKPDNTPSAWIWRGEDGHDRLACGHGDAQLGLVNSAGILVLDVIDLEAWGSKITVGQATVKLARELGIMLPSNGDGTRTPRKTVGPETPTSQETVMPEAGIPTESTLRERLTDLGNALRFVRLKGIDLRYVGPWNKWLIWNGKRWEEDHALKVVRYFDVVLRELYQTEERLKSRAAKLKTESMSEMGEMDVLSDGADAQTKQKIAEANRLDGQATALGSFARKSENRTRIESAIALARSRPEVEIQPSELDRDISAINAQNCTIDLKTGDPRPHQRKDYFTKILPVSYSKDAKCPMFDKFLLEIMDGRKHLVDYLQRVFGYCLTGSVQEDAMWILHGGGENGKTTLVETIAGAMGNDYAITILRDLLVEKNFESHPTGLMDLFGKRMVYTGELEEGQVLREALVKQLTGKNRIRGRRMREDSWEYDPTHKIFLDTNHRPVIRGTDHAIWRRIRLVPFMVKITKEQKDDKLKDKLKAEYPGILAWLVRGAVEWRRAGLQDPPEVLAATISYREGEDQLGEFVSVCCITGNPSFQVKAGHLYDAYKSHCKSQGIEPMTGTAFGRRMRTKFPKRDARDGTWYSGIGLIERSTPVPS